MTDRGIIVSLNGRVFMEREGRYFRLDPVENKIANIHDVVRRFTEDMLRPYSAERVGLSERFGIYRVARYAIVDTCEEEILWPSE